MKNSHNSIDPNTVNLSMVAKKRDRDYWANDEWRKDKENLLLWSTDIVKDMLNEGLVMTTYNDDKDYPDGPQSVTGTTCMSKRNRDWGLMCCPPSSLSSEATNVYRRWPDRNC